ncbi:MAG: TonB-dependent receptor [Desulfobacteraceae bacterium]|nr:TonB-dependent receptor [Desulfobacteraceae bacterium]
MRQGLIWRFVAGVVMAVMAAGPGPAFARESSTLEEMVVVGERIGDYVKNNPNQVVSISEQEMVERNFLEVYEALESMAGVDVKYGSSGLGARISIRGGGGSGSVLVLLDGRPINKGQYGGVDLGSIPIDLVKKITVFKPPAPVWLGPGSSAGAIYIETKKGRKRKEPKTSGRIRTGAGSHGRFDLNGSCKINKEKSSLLLAAGYGHRDGKRTNSHRDKGHFSFNWDRETDALSTLQVNGKYYLSDHGVSGPTYNPTPGASQRYEKGSLDLKFKGFIGESMDYDLKAYGDLTDLKDRANNGDTARLDASTAGLGGELLWSGDQGKNELRGGASFENNEIDHSLTGEHHRNAFSLHGVHTLKRKPYIVTSGIRGDYTKDFHFSPAGNLGVSYELLPRTLLKTSCGYSVNLPTFGQLYQPSHGSIDQVRGNPDLDKERIVSLSLGMQHDFQKKNQVELAFFWTGTRDLIKYQRGDDLINRPENVDQATKRGVEATLKYKINDHFSFDLNHVWQRTENEDNNKELSYAPDHAFKATLKSKFKCGTRVEWTVRSYSSQFTDTDNTEEEKIDAYTTADAKIIYPVKIKSKSGEVYLNFRNLFDEDYEVHYGYPDDGFRFLCGVNVNF